MIVEIALVALIGYTRLGNAIFATAPIGSSAWTFILPFAAVMLLGEETREWVARTWLRSRPYCALLLRYEK